MVIKRQSEEENQYTNKKIRNTTKICALLNRLHFIRDLCSIKNTLMFKVYIRNYCDKFCAVNLKCEFKN